MTEVTEHLRMSGTSYGRTDEPMRRRNSLPICVMRTLADELFWRKKRKNRCADVSPRLFVATQVRARHLCRPELGERMNAEAISHY